VILPTCLRDYVSAVHRAILDMVYALRRLQGQVVSLAEAKSLKVEPGSPVVDNRSLRSIRSDLVVGLVRLEGSLPPNHLNPLLHRLVHYPRQTAIFGRIWAMSMWAFERYNKKIKDKITNNAAAEESIAHNVLLEIATRFVDMAEMVGADIHEDEIAELRKRRTSCYLKGILKLPYR